MILIPNCLYVAAERLMMADKQLVQALNVEPTMRRVAFDLHEHILHLKRLQWDTIVEQDPKMLIGEVVFFDDKVFLTPYEHCYDAYRGHMFVVRSWHEGDHLLLECVTGDVKMGGAVHPDELRPSIFNSNHLPSV